VKIAKLKKVVAISLLVLLILLLFSHAHAQVFPTDPTFLAGWAACRLKK